MRLRRSARPWPLAISSYPAASTAAICECFGYDAFIVQRGEMIAALPAIATLGKNTSWGTDIESRNVLFVPR